MNDCVNGDIRDLLPELVNGTLAADEAVRVQAHLRECGECAAEVELLRAARAAMRLAPPVDTARLAAAVQSSTAQRLAARRAPTRVTRVASVAGLALVLALGAIGVWSRLDSPAAETAATVTRGPVQLALGGDVSQLEDDQLLALMDEVSELEAMPGEEPASMAIEPVLPVSEEEL